MTWKLDGGFVVFSFPLFFSILFFLTEKTRFSFSAASAFLLSLLLYVFFIHVWGWRSFGLRGLRVSSRRTVGYYMYM